MQSIALYIHWPFCKAKCPYCDFNSHVAETIDHERWTAAYVRGLDYYAERTGRRPVNTVYFGGGTPSLMRPETVGRIIDHIQKRWLIANDIEITLEANPTSIEADKFTAFKAAGVNRVSVGVQALDDQDLAFFGREHSVAEARAAIEVARTTFDRFSFDLIYARPQQTLQSWEAELRKALDMAGEHMSLYQLTIERNTPFYNAYRRKEFSVPDQDVAADFYELTQGVMAAAGLPAYEVSNHASGEDAQSRHNLAYWRYQDYIGLGPDAHGRLSLDRQKYATREHRAPALWLERTEERGTALHEPQTLSAEEQFTEALMMGLRLREGVELDWRPYVSQERMQTALDEGWIERTGNHLRATPDGRLRLNAVLEYLLPG